jgi:competence protein ComEA
VSQAQRIMVAAAASAAVLAAAGAWLLLAPTPPAGPHGPVIAQPSVLPSGPGTSAPARPTPPSPIVVDVQGAVGTPGVHSLPAGSRVADAVRAAGGYAADADLDAAATTINLAAPLADGQQIVVPRIGAAAAAGGNAQPPGSALAPGSGGGGLVNLNTASADELEALPGIGPVTVEKILAERAKTPFASLDDAVARGSAHRGQLEDIRELATAS